MASEEKIPKLDDTSNNQSISLVWLDNTINDAETNIADQIQLRKFDSQLKTFKDKDECDQYLKSQGKARIVFIVNGSLGYEIVKSIEYLSQIISIYVYCWDKEKHEKWAKEFSKIKRVVNKFDDLKEQIQTNHFPIVNQPIKKQENAEIGEIDHFYFISDISIIYVSQIKSTSKDKDDFVSLCKSEIKKNASQNGFLQQFQETYSSDQVIQWLGKDSIFTKTINKVFNSTNTEAIYDCRFFLHDIRKQFETHKCTTSVHVYRGELMDDKKFRELKDLIEKTMAFKSFYFTTLDRHIASSYIRELPNVHRVLFEIEADPQIENVKSFIKTDSFPELKDKDGVIFMIGSIFKINEINDEENNLTIVKMVLCGNKDHDPFKDQLNNTNEEKDLIGYAQLLCNMSQYFTYPTILDNADQFIQKYLNELSEDHSDRIRCYDTLGNVHFAKRDFDSSLNWYEKSLEMKKTLSPNSQDLAVTYANIASVYSHKSDTTKALDVLKQALMISEQIYADDPKNLIFYYNQFINIYESDGKFKDALTYYFQIYNILLKHFDIDDVNLAGCYNNIGKTYVSLGQYALALGFCKTSLQIKLNNRSFFTSESIALAHKAVASVYRFMKDIDQALIHFKESATLYNEVYSSNHETVLEIEEIIQLLLSGSK